MGEGTCSQRQDRGEAECALRTWNATLAPFPGDICLTKRYVPQIALLLVKRASNPPTDTSHSSKATILVISSAFLYHTYQSKMRWPQPVPCRSWYIGWLEDSPHPHPIRVEKLAI